MDSLGFRQFVWYVGYLIDDPFTFHSYALTCRLFAQCAHELMPMKKNEYVRPVRISETTTWKVLPNGLAHYIDYEIIVNTGRHLYNSYLDRDMPKHVSLYPNIKVALSHCLAISSCQGMWWMYNTKVLSYPIHGRFCMSCNKCHKFWIWKDDDTYFHFKMTCNWKWIHWGKTGINVKRIKAVTEYAKKRRKIEDISK
jgi:hypothetical protein